MAKGIKVGDVISFDFRSNPLPLGQRPCFFDKNGKEINLPIGTVIHFENGFLIRQHDPRTGAGFYGQPEKNFWTVTVLEINGVKGLLLPAGRVDLSYRTTNRKGQPVTKVQYIDRGPIFVSLREIRDPSSIEIQSIPARGTK